MDVTATGQPQGVGKGRSADAVRSRSRDLYELLLDRIQERIESADTFTLSELSQAANVAGRIGLGGDEQRDNAVTIRIIRDPLPMQTYEYDGHVAAPPSYPVLPPAMPSNEADGYADRVEAMARDARTVDDA